MKLVRGLVDNTRISSDFRADHKVNRLLLRRAKKVVRKRRLDRIERQIKMILGNEYKSIGSMLPFYIITKFKKELNKKSWKSERMFLEALTKEDVFDYWTNYPVLNRFFADVYFPKFDVVVELDGSIHKKESVKQKDARKDYWLTRFNHKVYRYSILNEKDARNAVKDLLTKIDKTKVSSITHSGLPNQFLKTYPPKSSLIPYTESENVDKPYYEFRALDRTMKPKKKEELMIKREFQQAMMRDKS